MKSFIYGLSAGLVVCALAAGAPDAWAQHHGGGGGGGGGARVSHGGGGGGGTAVSRGSSGGTRTASSGGSRTAAAPSSVGTAQPRGGTRPNYGNPAVGHAVQRPGYGYPGYPGHYPGYYPGYGYGHYHYYPYNPYYWYGYGGFALGLSFYYDPFWWGYPYSYAYPYPYGYYGGYYGGGGGSAGGYDAPSSGGYVAQPQQDEGPKGGLKLKIEPATAEVYVDGYYVGTVDEFNGAFQRLNIAAGNHRIEVRSNGYQALAFDVKIVPHDTISYSAQLKPAK